MEQRYHSSNRGVVLQTRRKSEGYFALLGPCSRFLWGAELPALPSCGYSALCVYRLLLCYPLTKTYCLKDIKYTPCPAWILCDRRSTCPFKHFDALPSISDSEPVPAPPPPPPPPPPQMFYPPPLPPPVTYTSPTLPPPNPVEVNGTTYFPIAHDTAVADEYQCPVQTGPIPVPVPMAPPILVPPPTHLPEPIMPPPVSPPPSYHYVPQVYQPHVEYPLERAYVTEPSPPLTSPNPAVVPEGTALNNPNSLPAGSEHEPAPAPVLVPEVETAANNNSAESIPEDQRRKRRSNGHVRRISINVKTGEVVERTLEGRHGVYGL